MGLAVGVIVGTAAKDLVNAVVEDVIMPIVKIFLPGENWRTASFVLGSVEFRIGHLIGASLDFLIIALVVYLFLKYVMKQDKIKKP